MFSFNTSILANLDYPNKSNQLNDESQHRSFIKSVSWTNSATESKNTQFNNPTDAQKPNLVFLQKLRSPGVLQALINTHNLQSLAFDKPNNLSKIPHGRIAQIMEHSQIPATLDIAVERLQLALGRVGVCPHPVFDVDTPVDDLWVLDTFC